MNERLTIQPANTDVTQEDIQRQRVRITYEKGDEIKFISHQDEFTAWERALRRADLPLLYKQGFNPQPHIQFASPLGVGFSGKEEHVDVTFAPPLPLEEIRKRIASSLPPGLRVHDLAETELNGPALQSQLIGADYTLTILSTLDDLSSDQLTGAVADFLRSTEQWRTRERKGKLYRYNLRPLVLELEYQGYDADREEHTVFLRVQQREGATGRPDEVVSALALDAYARRLCRDRLYFAFDPEHADLFEKYSVVSKAEIADASASASSRRRRKSSSNKVCGRTISERAADEIG